MEAPVPGTMEEALKNPDAAAHKLELIFLGNETQVLAQ